MLFARDAEVVVPGLIRIIRQAAAAGVLAATVAGCATGHAQVSHAHRPAAVVHAQAAAHARWLPGLYLGSMAGDWYGPFVRPSELLLGADWTIGKLRWPVWNWRHAEGRGYWVACHGAGGPSATWPTISSSSTWPNAETRLVRYNLLHPGQPRRAAFTVVPSAVFADPQVASAGATEQDLQAQGRDYAAATRPYSDTTYGRALEDTGSFVKILADPATRLLLGAHLLGPQAATLIQPLVQAMYLGSTVDQVASGVLYIHPALTEVV